MGLKSSPNKCLLTIICNNIWTAKFILFPMPISGTLSCYVRWNLSAYTTVIWCILDQSRKIVRKANNIVYLSHSQQTPSCFILCAVGMIPSSWRTVLTTTYNPDNLKIIKDKLRKKSVVCLQRTRIMCDSMINRTQRQELGHFVHK